MKRLAISRIGVSNMEYKIHASTVGGKPFAYYTERTLADAKERLAKLKSRFPHVIWQIDG